MRCFHLGYGDTRDRIMLCYRLRSGRASKTTVKPCSRPLLLVLGPHNTPFPTLLPTPRHPPLYHSTYRREKSIPRLYLPENTYEPDSDTSKRDSLLGRTSKQSSPFSKKCGT